MAKLITGKNVINIYGSVIVGLTTTLKVAVYKGKNIFNWTNKTFEDATAISTGALPAANLVPTTAIPNATNRIGYEMTLTNLPVGNYDLVIMDDLVYKEGIRFHKASGGQITVVPQ